MKERAQTLNKSQCGRLLEEKHMIKIELQMNFKGHPRLLDIGVHSKIKGGYALDCPYKFSVTC